MGQLAMFWNVLWQSLRLGLGRMRVWMQDQLQVVGQVLDELWRQVVDFAVGLLPADLASTLNARPWEQVLEYAEPVAWLIPIHAMIGILLAAHVVCGTIRLGRWILALIPTIGG